MYETKTATVGILEPEELTIVEMPRERFIELVEETIKNRFFDTEVQAKLRAELLPVAQTMPRYPIDQWVNTRRGCGCVVGEYLIASKEVERVAICQALQDATRARRHADGNEVSASTTSVEEMLRDHPLRDELLHFGNAINDVIRDEIDIYGHGIPIDSVEIVD